MEYVCRVKDYSVYINLQITVAIDKDKSQATIMVVCTAIAKGFPTSRLSHN